MRYFALATDYDGTLAEHGRVPSEVISALERFRESGRHLVMVTGRELEDLRNVFPRLDLFDVVVAENGALLYSPESDKCKLLAQGPPPAFVSTLEKHGVAPIYKGHVLVATLEDQKEKVLDAIQQHGLELQIIFNKGSIMVLPAGVNKATGLIPALDRLCLSARNTVAVGDAENDHAFLSVSERAVAVAGALDALKQVADLVTSRDAGQGVAELIGRILENDLSDVTAHDCRDSVLLGHTDDGDVRIPCYGPSVLIAGTSGGGKSTLSTGIIERLIDAEYQVCVFDPEGDYSQLPDVLTIGDSKRPPTVQEIVTACEQHPTRSVVATLIGLAPEERPPFFDSAISHLQELRARTGRPHWTVVDEAHHFAPADRKPGDEAVPKELLCTLFITLEPDHVQAAVLRLAHSLIAVGANPSETLQKFCSVDQSECPSWDGNRLEKGTALFWTRDSGKNPLLFRVAPCEVQSTRHRRTYSTADLTPDRSFYFRGPEKKLNLRAQNLVTFVQLMQGVDDETWMFHLRKGEYSQWFRDNIKNDELADIAADIEKRKDASPRDTRDAIKNAIEERFTLPA